MQQAAGGAFGGGRHAIREAQVADDYLRNVGSTASQLRNQAFNAASSLIQGDQNRALQASQANQQVGLQRAMQQAQLQQQASQFNTDMDMRGRQSDLDARYKNDQQKFGTIEAMAEAKARTQQLADQRTLQNVDLLAKIGGQQQQQNQAVLDVPYDLAEWRANMLASTPFPTLTNSKSKSSSFSIG